MHYWRFYPDGRWTRCVSQDAELPFWTLTERDGAGAKETFTSGTFDVTEAGSLVIKEPSETLNAQACLREYRWTIESDRLLPEPSRLPDHVALSFVPSDAAKAGQDPRSSFSVADTHRVQMPAPAPSPTAHAMTVTSSPVLGRSHPHPSGPPPVPFAIVPAEQTARANAASESTPRRSVPIVDADRVRKQIPSEAATVKPRPATIRRIAPPAESSVPARAAEAIPSPKGPPRALPVPISSRLAEAGPAAARIGRLAPQLSASRDLRVDQDAAATPPRNALGGWAISLSAAPLMLLWAYTVATSLRSAFDGGDAAPRLLAIGQGLAGCVGWGCLLWLAWNPSLQEKPHLRPIDAWLWLGVVSMFLSPQMMFLGPPAFLLAAIVRGRRPNGVRRQSSWKRPLFALEATAAAVPCVLAVVGGLPTAMRAGVLAMPDGALGAGLPGLLVALAVGLALQQYVVLVVNTIAATACRFGLWSWLALPGVVLAMQVAMEAWRDDDAARFAAGAPILLVTLHFVLLQPWRAQRDRAGRPRLQPVS